MLLLYIDYRHIVTLATENKVFMLQWNFSLYTLWNFGPSTNFISRNVKFRIWWYVHVLSMDDNRISVRASEMSMSNEWWGDWSLCGETKYMGEIYKTEYGKCEHRYQMSAYESVQKDGLSVIWWLTQVEMLSILKLYGINWYFHTSWCLLFHHWRFNFFPYTFYVRTYKHT
jgi:hypothetical protein